MEINALLKFWPLIHSIIQEFWAITEPQIEEEAAHINIPLELYYYSELGLQYFSLDEFQERDPFSNPEQFETQFARLEIKDWIVPANEDGRYRVSERARDGVQRIVRAGDACLKKFEEESQLNLERLLAFLKRIVLANNNAPEPPKKWAIANRFRVATRISPIIVQIRECLMDLYAYRDDSHLAAARPHFNRAGMVWSAFWSVCSGSATNAEQIAEAMSFRGYQVNDYAAALQAAFQVGWLEETEISGTFRPTPFGRELHEQVEKLTDEYFYYPWAMFKPAELDELYDLLLKLREQLHEFKKSS